MDQNTMSDEEAQSRGFKNAIEYEARRKRWGGDKDVISCFRGWDKDGNEVHIATGEEYTGPPLPKKE